MSLLLFFLPLTFFSGSEGSAAEFRLIQDLKENYDVIERPVKNHSEALPVKLRVLLQQIIDVDERNQVLTLIVWTEVSWRDYKLTWEPNEYGNITDIQLPQGQIWKPDILLFNSATDKFDANFPVNCIVSNSGDVFIAPPGIVKISCEMEMTWFPFDEQICYLKYGSWTYNGAQLDLSIDDNELNPQFLIDMKYYVPNDEFDILAAPANKTIKRFGADTYIELYFHLHLKRRIRYYLLNWIIPAVLISMSNVIQFMMPTAGGEKITLQTTNVLATLVFLAQTAKSTPPTSESIPVLSAFFSASLCLMGASTVATVLIMNVHWRPANLREIGPWTRNVFIETLPKFLFLPKQVQELKEEHFDEEHQRIMENGSSRVQKIQAMAHALKPRLSMTFDDLIIYDQLEKNVNEIIDILRIFEEKQRNDFADQKTECDWKFMAAVLDRFCIIMYFSLFLFTFLTLVIGILIKN